MICVAGATGFLGTHIVPALARARIPVRALVRKSTSKPAAQRRYEIGILREASAEIIELGDPFVELRAEHLAGCRAILNLVGILTETRRQSYERMHVDWVSLLLDFGRRAGVQKFVHIGALGTASDAPSAYHRTKWRAEELIRSSNLNRVILRPSVMVGRGDGFTNVILDLLRFPFVAPMPGNGLNKLQPLYVGDLARAIVAAVLDTRMEGREIDIGGPDVFTFKEALRIVAQLTGRRRLALPIPLPILRAQAFVLENVLSDPPITREQIKMLGQDNTCDFGPLSALLPWSFTRFEVASTETAKARLEGIGNLARGQFRPR